MRQWIALVFLLVAAPAAAQIGPFPPQWQGGGTLLSPPSYSIYNCSGSGITCTPDVAHHRVNIVVPGGGGGGVHVSSPISGDGSVGTPLSCPLCLTGTPTAAGDLMYSTAGTRAMSALHDVALGQVLHSGGVGAAPGYSAIVNSDLPGSGAVTVGTSAPLAGGGAVALGASLTLSCASCLTGTPAAIGDLMYSTAGGQAMSRLIDVAVGQVLHSGGVGAAPGYSVVVGADFGSQTQNFVFAAPSGSSGNPGFRSLVSGDIPSLTALYASVTTTISAGTGLSGGGDLSANRTISLPNTGPGANSCTLCSVTIDAQGRVTADSSGTAVTSGGTGSYGDGSDSTVTFDGSAAVTGTSRSGNTYTVTRDVFYSTVTVNSGIDVITNGFRFFVSTLLTNNGTIHWDGKAGVGSTAGGNLSSTVASTLTGNNSVGLGGGTGGAAATGSPGNSATAHSLGGNGGAGGTGTNAGGGGGTSTAPIAQVSMPRYLPLSVQGFFLDGTQFISGGTPFLFINGGSGGGGGGAAAASTGGGGGGGGGPLILSANSITMGASALISAVGGAGGNGAGVTAGGGGGGGGGAVLLTYHTLNDTSSRITVTHCVGGGGGGTPTGVGASGTPGSNGTLIQVVN